MLLLGLPAMIFGVALVLFVVFGVVDSWVDRRIAGEGVTRFGVVLPSKVRVKPVAYGEDDRVVPRMVFSHDKDKEAGEYVFDWRVLFDNGVTPEQVMEFINSASGAVWCERLWEAHRETDRVENLLRLLEARELDAVVEESRCRSLLTQLKKQKEKVENVEDGLLMSLAEFVCPTFMRVSQPSSTVAALDDL
jgi:hypothetical protein